MFFEENKMANTAVDSIKLSEDMFICQLLAVAAPLFDNIELDDCVFYVKETGNHLHGKACIVNGSKYCPDHIQNIESDVLVVCNCESIVLENLYVKSVLLLSNKSLVLKKSSADNVFCLDCNYFEMSQTNIGEMCGFSKVFHSIAGSAKKIVFASEEFQIEDTSFGRSLLYSPGVLKVNDNDMKINENFLTMDMKLLHSLNNLLSQVEIDEDEDEDDDYQSCEFSRLFVRNYYNHTPFPIEWMCNPGRIPGFDLKNFRRSFLFF